MTEEQQKVVEKEVQAHLEQGFHGMIDDMLYSCLDRLRDKDLLPDLETSDGPNPEVQKLMVEIELCAACGTISQAQRYLQNRREGFPGFLPKRKVAIVGVEYDEEEYDEDEDYTFTGIFVRKVVVDGKEVQLDQPRSPFDPMRFWLLVEREDAALILKHDPG